MANGSDKTERIKDGFYLSGVDMRRVNVCRATTFAILLVVAIAVVLIAGSFAGDPDQYARDLLGLLLSSAAGYAAGKFI